MNEDSNYRSSTQYRLWSYTEESLASLRSTTNNLAAIRVKDAIQRLHSTKAEETGYKDGSSQNSPERKDVDCLTVEEEQKLVSFYCVKAMELADFCDFPTNLKATAVQYLKRFYLSNSPMTYHPKSMMPSALFLATKTENYYISLKSFAAKLPKTTAEDIVAPEFLLTQGLRFTFDVRHPFRGLEGGFMELMAMAMGNYVTTKESKMTSESVQAEMMKIEPTNKGKPKAKNTQELVSHIQETHGKAKDVLKTSALLTDAYFLYSPPQIWLTALLSVDEPLALFYVDVKVPASSALKIKLTTTLYSCKDLLQSSTLLKPGGADMKELTRIDKKLYKCRNPEKMDLVGINKAQKREGDGKDRESLNEKIVKKRKLEREQGLKEGEDVFGPSLDT